MIKYAKVAKVRRKFSISCKSKQSGAVPRQAQGQTGFAKVKWLWDSYQWYLPPRGFMITWTFRAHRGAPAGFCSRVCNIASWTRMWSRVVLVWQVVSSIDVRWPVFIYYDTLDILRYTRESSDYLIYSISGSDWLLCAYEKIRLRAAHYATQTRLW